MKLSFVVPVYKVEKYLDECVESLINQTIDDYEIILVDDGSPDQCPKMCDDYSQKYSFIKVIHQKNKGLSAARNTGLKIAQGEYVSFVDSDDFVFEEFGEKMYTAAKNADVDILFGNFNSCDDTDTDNIAIVTDFDFITNRKLFKEDINNLFTTGTNYKGSLIYVWRSLYRVAFLRENNIFFDETIRFAEDAPFNTEAFLKATSMLAFNYCGYVYRVREQSLTRSDFDIEHFEKINYQFIKKKEQYHRFCENPRVEYEIDLADYSMNMILINFLRRFYSSSVRKQYFELKKILKSEMVQQSLKYYDSINKDGLKKYIYFFSKKKLYFMVHIICKYIIFK